MHTLLVGMKMVSKGSDTANEKVNYKRKPEKIMKSI